MRRAILFFAIAACSPRVEMLESGSSDTTSGTTTTSTASTTTDGSTSTSGPITGAVHHLRHRLGERSDPLLPDL